VADSMVSLKQEPSVGTSTASVKLLPFTPEIDAAWNRYVRDHPSGTFFHLTGWKRVMEKTYSYEPHYYYALRDGRIVGVAPVFLVSDWMTGSRLISLPFATYGGICADDSEIEKALARELEKLAEELKVEYLELRNRTSADLSGYHPISRYSTFTIPLVSDTGALYRSFPKDIRYMIRKGEKAGLSVQHGNEQIEVFYKLLTINLRRLGTPAFPRELFEQLLREYAEQIDVTVVYKGEEAVAAGMSFFFRDSMQPYYVGSLDEAKTLAANNFLWWELIKRAAKSGCSTFDFGRSKNDSGNFDFKKKWEPRIEALGYQVRLIRCTLLPNVSPANPKFQLATNIWKKLPIGLTRALGPRLVRWFP